MNTISVKGIVGNNGINTMGARLGESVHGNTYEELLPLLDYYYDRDHLKAYCIANLLLNMDVSDEHQQRIELRRCIAAYYAGLYIK